MVLDAGTGIRRLGYELAASRETDVTVLLTHFHWDHIQGLPFFMPLYGPDTTVRLVGPRVGDRGVEALVTGQWDAGYFSIPFRELRADVEWEELAGTDGARPGSGTGREVGALRVTWMRVRHPSSAVAYRVEASGRSVCYAPDNELAGGEYAVGPDWRSRFVDFVSGADLLLHDSMFTEEEYGEREGWGHSTFGQVLDLAAEAGVERLAFFHHAPDRTDDELDAILARARADAAKEGLALEVDAAREDEELIV